MTLLIGIDDAGRGPVLGPMILAGVLIKPEEEQIIKNWGAKDSKLLTPKQRGEIKEKITSQFKHHLETSTPKEIDDHKNLNLLEAEKTAKIINHLTKNLNEKIKVIIDCPSVNIQSWTKDVQKLLENPENISLSCEHKADPKTKKFISENFDKEEYKELIRFSWNTVKKLIKAKEASQQKLF